jgi:hypothetical protein
MMPDTDTRQGAARSAFARRPRPLNSERVPSLINDTAYRRLRRRLVSRLHDLDDLVSTRTRGPRRILFEAASPMSFAIFKPVHALLEKDPRLEVWFTAYGRAWQPAEIYGQFGITANVVPASRARWMKVDAYVNTDFWDMTWLHRRTCRIHLFHGVAGKYALDAPVEIAPLVSTFDSLMFANADRRNRYIEAGLAPDDPIKAALVGYPKVDCLVDGTLDRRHIATRLGLDPRTPTVIYAPTWSPYSSLNAMGEELIERLAAEGLQVIAKLHDRSYDLQERGSGGIDWKTRLAKYDGHPRVRVVRDADASPYLVASDAMVSDHSSVAFEFMILDRPVVVIDRPKLIARAGISPDKVRLLRSGAVVTADAREATAAVVEALQYPRRLSEERKRVAARLFYRPGTASARAAATIYRLIGLPEAAGTPEEADGASMRAVAVR